jgi:hypothetical protein
VMRTGREMVAGSVPWSGAEWRAGRRAPAAGTGLRVSWQPCYPCKAASRLVPHRQFKCNSTGL